MMKKESFAVNLICFTFSFLVIIRNFIKLISVDRLSFVDTISEPAIFSLTAICCVFFVGVLIDRKFTLTLLGFYASYATCLMFQAPTMVYSFFMIISFVIFFFKVAKYQYCVLYMGIFTYITTLLMFKYNVFVFESAISICLSYLIIFILIFRNDKWEKL